MKGIVILLPIVRFITGGVCVWARTDSLATLHSQPQLPQLTAAILNGGGWIKQGKMGKSKQGGDTWIFSHGSRFGNSPHPYPCENHAPSQFSCRERRWLGYLIKYAYLHDD